MGILRLLATLTLGTALSTAIAFVAGPPTSTNSTLVANPNTALADGTASMSLTFTAVDYYGNRAPGVAVTLSASGGNSTFSTTSGTTNASGVFATTLTSTYAQTEVITASFGTSNSVTTVVQFVPGAASSATSSLTLSPNSQIANNSNTITAFLTLRDARGNAISNVTPTFTASGTSTTVSSALVTSASGQTSATYQSTLAQNENALVSGGGLSFVAPMVFVAGPPAAAASSLAASPNIAAGNGSAAISLVATARDAQGNAVSGASVALSASGGNNTFGSSSATTNSSGIYMTTLTSTTMQTETITALIANSISETVSITFTGNANATNSTLAVSPNTQTVGPSNYLTTTLTLRDAAYNVLSGITPTWSASGGNNTITSSGATSTSGVSTATYSSTLAQNENVTVAAGGISLSQPISFTAGSPNAVTSTFYALPRRQIADNTSTIIATMTLQDAYSNPISGQTATFSASDGNIVASSPVTTNAGGVAQANLQSNVVLNANAQVTVSGLNYSAPIIFTGVPAQCGLTVNPNNQTTNGNITLSAVFTDQFGQPVPNLIASFSSAGSASISWPAFVTTNAQGSATLVNASQFAGVDKFIASGGNVTCAAQGNYLSQTPYCSGNPNYVASTYAVGVSPFGITTADFNGDGKLDVMVMNSADSNLGLLFGTGNGNFNAQTVIPIDGLARYFDVGDYNNDGYLDVAVAAATDKLRLYLGNGTGTFLGQRAFAVGRGTYTHYIASADFNKDGVLDFVLTNQVDATLSAFFGNGDGSVQPQGLYTVSPTPNYIATGDFNGDGFVDVAVTNYNGGTVSVLLGANGGTLRAVTTYSNGSVTPTGLAAGDFNGDGVQDIVVGNQGNGNLSLLLGASSGGFAAYKQFASGTYPQAALPIDLNGDGFQDVLVPNAKDNTVSAFLGTGGGSFKAALAFQVGAYPRSIAAGDFNRDSKKDFVVSNYNGSSITVLLYSSCN